MYVDPKEKVVYFRAKSQYNDNKFYILKDPVKIIQIPLTKTFNKFFEIPELYDKTLRYMYNLYSESGSFKQNFIQGNLWKDMLKKFDKTDGVPIPFFTFIDAFEPLNCLGSHAGKKSINAVYCHIPCLPNSISSKLSTYFLAHLAYDQDRKKYGNAKIFKPLIK